MEWGKGLVQKVDQEKKREEDRREADKARRTHAPRVCTR
jgi:hypothetical protein